MKCIILAAGKGTRMQSEDTHKVCFSINGKPAIIQAMNRYCMAGIDDFTVVVGTMAQQVMDCISPIYPDTQYAYQSQALGTGDAAKVGYKAGHSKDNIMITMGDKIVSSEICKALIDKFNQSNSDLVFAVVPKHLNKSGGNIVIDGGIKGIIEDLDVKKAYIYKELLNKLNKDIPFTINSYINDVIQNVITSEGKREKVLTQMNDIFSAIQNQDIDYAKELLEKGSSLNLCQIDYAPSIVDDSEYVNAAVYIFKSNAFEYGLEKLSDENAHGELYLTDVVNAICANPDYKVNILKVDKPNDILTYNNVNEFIRIQEILSECKKETIIPLDTYKDVDEWLMLFKEKIPAIMNTLQTIYGDNKELITTQIASYIQVLELYKKRYGSNKVVISRAPGRVNLMGRHVEHRGGCVNVISINREIICVGSLNDSGDVNIINTDKSFDDKTFNIAQHFNDVSWDNWLDYLDNDKIINIINESKGDWLNYVKAPIIKLQYIYQDRNISGMDLAYNGNIPIAAGLSSSSAIVVSTAEVTITLNNLDVHPQDFVDLCGEGEWFVGSRGGSGDHAAMKYGEKGSITSLGFFPFRYIESFPFPKGYKLIIANSFVKANKSTNALNSFNQPIASYEFGLMMLKDSYPHYAQKLEYLRDINPDTLNVRQSEIYHMIMSLPQRLASSEVFNSISSQYHEKIKLILKTHTQPDYYEIRSVMIYGIAECRRSFICAQLLKEHDFIKFGQMMDISHNGDRVFDSVNECQYHQEYDDKKLLSLIDDLQSEELSRVYNAQIENQSGKYSCSTREIDYIIDSVKYLNGVIGAQLSGAGLGGCVMILVHDDCVDEVVSTLNEKYYIPNSLEDGTTICIPVSGCDVLKCSS